MPANATAAREPLSLIGDNASRALTVLQSVSAQLVDELDTPGYQPDTDRLRELAFVLDELLGELEAH
jgi:hypothetical protein